MTLPLVKFADLVYIFREAVLKSISKWLLSFDLTCYSLYPANIYFLKGNNRKTRRRCEICSKLTVKTPERRQRRQ